MKSEYLLPHLFEAAYVVDSNRKIVFWNKKCEEITGYSAEEVVGQHCYNNLLRHVTKSGQQLCHNGCPLQASIKDNQVYHAEVFLHHKEGHRVPVSVRSIPFFDEEEQVMKAIEVFTDMKDESEILKQNRSLNRAVMTDKLTQVFNRSFLDYQIEASIREFETFNMPLAILFLDIDHFKHVNDTHGHAVGDRVLKQISKTLSMNVRKSDFVGRYGGEEFVVILRNVSSQNMLMIAEKIRTLVEATEIDLEDQSFHVTVSIGCSYYRKGLSKDAFIKEADSFMYKAKASGRNKVVSE